MKKMKTLVLAALLICGVGTTYAQNRERFASVWKPA